MSAVSSLTRSTAPSAVRSSECARTDTPKAARISLETASSGPGLRASRTRLRPAAASFRANSAPTPSDPPATTAQGPYSAIFILFPQLAAHVRFPCQEPGLAAIEEILLIAVDPTDDRRVGVGRQHGVVGIAVAKPDLVDRIEVRHRRPSPPRPRHARRRAMPPAPARYFPQASSCVL